MIKSKKLDKYYGTLAYADGRIKKVAGHYVETIESADGIKRNEFWRLKGDGYYDKIVSVQEYRIVTALDVTTAIVKVDGRTYVGHAQCDPNDNFNGAFGRQLALARAMHDNATINYLMERFKPDGDENDDDDISADDVDGSETFYCCHCGEPVDADGAIPDSYTDDIYCCQRCYLEAGGNIDPDGDDDGDNLCDYCLEDIPDGVGIEDADGHVYCCQECYEKAQAEKEMDGDEEE